MTDELQNRFIHDVRDHELTIKLDQDLYRHLRLSRPGSSAYHYNLVTWPGYLSITGDMGSYTFDRVADMFKFFRDGEMTNRINPQYWHEKAVAVDKGQGPKVFSQDRYKNAIQSDTNEWETTLGSEETLKADIEAQLHGWNSPTNTHEAYQLIHEFESTDGHTFVDFEYDLTDWSFHYMWALKAIVWGIKQYDLEKQERTQRHHDARVLAGEI